MSLKHHIPVEFLKSKVFHGTLEHHSPTFFIPINKFKVETLVKDRIFATCIPNILFIFNCGNRYSGEEVDS